MNAPTVDLAKPAGDGACRSKRPVYVERAELVLALPDHQPLAALGLTPDPLQQLATALASVRTEDGERADVVLDLVPVTQRRLAAAGGACWPAPSTAAPPPTARNSLADCEELDCWSRSPRPGPAEPRAAAAPAAAPDCRG